MPDLDIRLTIHGVMSILRHLARAKRRTHWIAASEKDTASVTLEKRLWDAADRFRANSGIKAQEYSGPIHGLVFLRFAARQIRHVRLWAPICSSGELMARNPDREALRHFLGSIADHTLHRGQILA
jgi:hypothetical protein